MAQHLVTVHHYRGSGEQHRARDPRALQRLANQLAHDDRVASVHLHITGHRDRAAAAEVAEASGWTVTWGGIA